MRSVCGKVVVCGTVVRTVCGKVVVCGTVVRTVCGKDELRSDNVEGLHCGPDRRGFHVFYVVC